MKYKTLLNLKEADGRAADGPGADGRAALTVEPLTLTVEPL